jgi:hypothetical protein
MQVVLSPSAEKSGRQITELAARRKRKREQQEGSRINDQKELFEEKL